MPGRFIADGCTRSGKLSDTGSVPALCIEYRPMLSSDRAFLVCRIRAFTCGGESDLASAEDVVLEELSGRLVSWTLRDSSGTSTPISVSGLRALETTLLASMATLVFGLNDLCDHDADRERNLVLGVQLHLSNPRLAARDCGDCQRHVYDERTGRRVVHAHLPVVRPAGTVPPCRIPHVGCPKGTPEEPRTLTTENQHVYRHYRECRATGGFPDDPIVRRHAVLIQAVEVAELRQRVMRRE